MARWLSLLAALLAFVLCQASQVRDIRPNIETGGEQQKTSFPIELLDMKAEDNVAVMFGLDLFNEIHTRLAQCREERRQVDVKFHNDSRLMLRYYQEAEKAIVNPRFEELVNENRQDIETNFERAFKELEKSRDKKLKRLESKCNNALDAFIEGRMQQALRYAENLIMQDPAEYTRLMFDVSAYATRLRGAAKLCSRQPHSSRPHPPPQSTGEDNNITPDSHGEMHFDLCYTHEIQRLINFIDHFLARADELSQNDDEDYLNDLDNNINEGSGDLNEEEEEEKLLSEKPTKAVEKPTEKPMTRPHPTQQEPLLELPMNGLFEPGPVLLGGGGGKPKDGKHEKTKPPPTEKPSDHDDHQTSPTERVFIILDPPLPEQTAPPTTKEIAPPTTESKPEHREEDNHKPEEDKATKSPDEEKATNRPDDKPKPTHEYPEWAEEAFNEVLDLKKDGEHEEEEAREQSDLIIEKEVKTAARSRSKSTDADEGEEPQHHGSINLNLPGVDVEIGSDGVNIETNIDPDGDGQSLSFGGSIVFDNDEALTTVSPSSEDEDSSFITYLLIYFFATLGCLLLLTIIVLVIAISVVRLKSSTSSKGTPLLTEEEKIAVMKQTGYVNPTYKFFDHVKGV